MFKKSLQIIDNLRAIFAKLKFFELYTNFLYLLFRVPSIDEAEKMREDTIK